MRFKVAFLALLGGSLSFLLAQLDRATLTGTVTDSSGAVVPSAVLNVSSEDTGLRRAAQTSDNGTYTFSQLPIGSYTVTVAHPGLRSVTMKDVRLGVGDNRTLNFQMEVSSTETSVTVEGMLAALETTSPVIGTVIGSRQMREIPLNGRHWASLMALAGR